MSRSRWHSFGLLVAAVSCVGSVQPVLGQGDDKARLRLKDFEPNAKRFEDLLEYKSIETMKVLGTELSKEEIRILKIRWTPQARQGEKLVVKQQIVAARVGIRFGESRIEFDSTNQLQSPDPMHDFFKSLMEVELTLIIDPAKKSIEEVPGRNNAINKIRQTHPQMTNLTNMILGDNGMMRRTQEMVKDQLWK